MHRSYECDFNWKIVVETFMECYHHLGAHAATFEPSFPARMSWTEDARPAWTLGHAAVKPGCEAFPRLLHFAPAQSHVLYGPGHTRARTGVPH